MPNAVRDRLACVAPPRVYTLPDRELHLSWGQSPNGGVDLSQQRHHGGRASHDGDAWGTLFHPTHGRYNPNWHTIALPALNRICNLA